MILNQEFGNGEDFDDVLYGKDSIRFDSSNSYIRYDINLLERQKAKQDLTEVPFIYPINPVVDSYNTINNKSKRIPSLLSF